MDNKTVNEFFDSHGWKLISSPNSKIKSLDRIVAQCKCGNKLTTTIKQFKRNKTKRCKQCVKPSNKYSIDDIKSIIEAKGGKLLDSVYNGIDTKINIITSDGVKTKVTFRQILKTDELLSICESYKQRKTSQRYSIEDVKKILSKHSLKLLSNEYINNTTHLHIECTCGEHYSATLQMINNSKFKKCPLCTKKLFSDVCKNDKDVVQKNLERIGYSLIDGEEYISSKHPFIVNCSCGNEKSIIYNNIQRDEIAYCSKCRKKSSFEEEVSNFISNIYGGNIKYSDRTTIKPLELDILIPEKNIAFECDGIYWHSDKFKDKDYHLNKTLLCEEKGIKLIHINEAVWYNKKDIIKDIIKKSLGMTSRLYARKCSLYSISSKVANEFIDKNHIQGSVNSSINYGLFYDNELVSVLTMGKSRFKKCEYEVYRYANKLSYTVIGGFSKLLKNILKQENIACDIVSYCDYSLFSGTMYEKCGFDLSHMSKPNYKYFKPSDGNYILYNRVQFQKHKLKNKLLVYDDSLTESQNMKNNGYLRFWDCGNKVFKLKKLKVIND